MRMPSLRLAICLFIGLTRFASRDQAAATGAPKMTATPGAVRSAAGVDASMASCLPPYFGEAIPAMKILRDLSEGRSVELQGRVIDGNLDADLVWPPADDRKLSLRVIPVRLRLESCRINGRVSFPRSVFQTDLSLTCSEVLGEIDLSDSEIRGALQLERARVQGQIRLANLSVALDTSFKRAVVEDRIDASGVHLRGVSFAGGEFHREVDLSRAVVGAVDLSAAVMAGAVRLDDLLVLSGLAGREATFGRGLTLSSARIVGQIDLSGATFASGLSFSDVSVGGNVVIPLSCDGLVSLSDVSVGRNLVMIDGNFGDLAMTRMKVNGSSELQGVRFAGRVVIQDSDFGDRFNASEAFFGGDCEFRKVHFPGEDPMSGALFARSPTLVDTVLPKPPRVKSEEGEPEPSDEEGDGAADDDPPNDEP